MHILPICGLALLALGACAATEVSPHEAPVKSITKQAAADPSERVCRTEKVTGTRFGTRVCATREEWAQHDAAISDAGRETAGNIARGVAVTPPNLPGG